MIRNVDSLHFWSPFHSKTIEQISQEEIYDYFRNTHKGDIVTVETLRARDNVVIYPEDIIGNPAEQKYVVRWLLFFPIPLAVQHYSFENDYICFFSDYIFNLYDNLCKNLNVENHLTNKITKLNILTIFHFNKGLYKDNQKPRKGGTFIIRKGYPPNSFIINKPSEIHYHKRNIFSNYLISQGFEQMPDGGTTHEQMVEVFNFIQSNLDFEIFNLVGVNLSEIIKMSENMDLIISNIGSGISFFYGLIFNKPVIAFTNKNCSVPFNFQRYAIEHKVSNTLFIHPSNIIQDKNENFYVKVGIILNRVLETIDKIIINKITSLV